MKKENLSKLASIVVLAVLLVTLTGCPPKECPENDTPMKEQVRDYLNHCSTEVAEHQFASGYSAYFDFSNGMRYAYNVPENRKNLESVTKLITGFKDEWEVYSLAYDQVKREDLSQTELYQKIINTNCTAIKAPINVALREIVNDDKLALLVTDFEEYEKSDVMGKEIIEETAYATEDFEAWLLKGGVIKFYIMDFVETLRSGNLNKKLFFVVFDNKKMELSKKIDQSMTGGAHNYQEYVLRRDSYRVFTDYRPGKGGNYEDNADPMILQEYGSYSDGQIEFYDMANPWSTVLSELHQAKQMDKKCEGLLYKLYIDLSNEETRNIKSLKLKITDITEDFYAYSDHQFAMRYKPQSVDDGNGSEIIQIDPKSPEACFYDAEGNLLPEYEYKPFSKPVVNEELLEINQEAFERSRAEDPSKTHIIIDFAKIYSDAEFQDNEIGSCNLVDEELFERISRFDGHVLQVDVCVAYTSFDNASKLNQLFDFKSNIWNKDGSKMVRDLNKTNDCISRSILNVLQQSKGLDYDGEVVHTYIIKG